MSVATKRALGGPLLGVMVSAGPGSYTGLRVGVMSAKALAYATGCRLVAVPKRGLHLESRPMGSVFHPAGRQAERLGSVCLTEVQQEAIEEAGGKKLT